MPVTRHNRCPSLCGLVITRIFNLVIYVLSQWVRCLVNGRRSSKITSCRGDIWQSDHIFPSFLLCPWKGFSGSCRNIPVSQVPGALTKTEAHNVLLKGTTLHPVASGTSCTGHCDISGALEGNYLARFSNVGNKHSFGSPSTKRKAFFCIFYSNYAVLDLKKPSSASEALSSFPGAMVTCCENES